MNIPADGVIIGDARASLGDHAVLDNSRRPIISSMDDGAWEWRLQARCRTEDPSLFFHPDGERGRARAARERRAKRVCADCPVRTACHEHSLRYFEAFGIWGGMTEGERSKLLPTRVTNVRTHRGTFHVGGNPQGGDDLQPGDGRGGNC